ncbi:LexA family protein [Bifidobacterium xylocopae]|uniref:Peptidase S24 n=1 Tax=Bifidobacterium xylocopae TaxID=2493119 RepID=A0A366KED8_9BIFI|nr:S24 family peptidase [Bifidobacterium xylocopae]RBQ00077.1 peptidase S24 [Bifidobacterium xylocopae]
MGRRTGVAPQQRQTAEQRGREGPAGVSTVASIRSAAARPRKVPIALEAVHAGFPSVAQDYFSGDFSFDEHVFVHPDSTFVVKVAGDSMTGAGIFDSDLLVVDRALDPCDGDVVIAILNDELTVKRLRSGDGRTWLQAENPAYPDFRPQEDEVLVIWGVVTGSYHRQREECPTKTGRQNAPEVTYPQPGAHTGKRRPLQTRPETRKTHQSADPDQERRSPYPSRGWEDHA